MSAFRVINAEAGAVRIPEIEFVQIRLQVLFAAVVIHATHAALENAKIAFDCVRRRLAARIFAVAMIDRLMRRERLAGLLVELRFVRVEVESITKCSPNSNWSGA